MLGQKHKLSLGLKQFALFGAILGLMFGSGAFSYTEVFADEYNDWKEKYDEIKEKIKHYKKKDKKKYKEWKKKLNDFKKKHNNFKVYVCHDGKDKKISINALIAHLKHGDSKGKCDDDDKDDDKKFKKGKVHTGDGPPPDKLGKKGDLYFDSWDDDSLEYYVKIGKKNWELRGTLVEPSNDCERGDVLKFNEVDNKWVCTNDLVEDDDADPGNELQDLGINERDLSLSGSSVTIPLPFALDNQSCVNADEVVTGIDTNGKVICEKVAGEISLTTEIVSGDSEILNFEVKPDTSGTLTCSDGGLVTGFNVLIPSENGVALITELELNSEGDKLSYTLFNPSEDIDIEVEVEVDGEEGTGLATIPGRSIEVIPQIFCVSVVTP